MPYNTIEKQREHGRQYYRQHKNKIQTRQRRYYQQHKTRIIAYVQQHRDKDAKREYDQKYNLLRKDTNKQQHKIYYQNNKETIKQRYDQYYQNHRAEAYKRCLKRKCGSVERHNEAMQKYDGWCAFACDREAYLVHHMDGKNIFNSPKREVNNDLSNLLPLCNSCHAWLHNNARRYFDARRN